MECRHRNPITRFSKAWVFTAPNYTKVVVTE